MEDDIRRLWHEWLALKSLWEEGRHGWRDAVADRFERQFWERWEETLPAFLHAAQDLDEAARSALAGTEE